MAVISGAQTNAIVQIASTWGTAVAGGANDKFAGEITFSSNAQELVRREIGTGNHMVRSATKGAVKPSFNLTMEPGFTNTFGPLLAQFMGTSSVGAEITSGQGDYLHTITFNTTLNAKYVTVAFETSSTTVIEFPTSAVRSITIKTTSIPGYLEANFECVANKIELSTAVNTNAICAAATENSGNEMMTADFVDYFYINTQSGGAPGSGNQYNITSWELTLTRPQELPSEIKGSAGNSAPRSGGLFEGRLKVTAIELADHTYFTAWDQETVYKSISSVSGSLIGSTTAREFRTYLPGMQLLQEPKYSLTSAGVNAVEFDFKLLKAAANPTGFTSTYPYFLLYNNFSTGYLA